MKESLTYVKTSSILKDLTENNPLVTSFLTIDLSAISHNIASLKTYKTAPHRFMAMIKASAYGTEIETMAFFLLENGIDIFGVAYVAEGVLLREKGFKGDIFVTNATPEEAPFCVEYNLEVSLDNPTFLLALEEACVKKNKRAKVHLNLDTGMNRFGCKVENLKNLLEVLKKANHLDLEGMFTHFSSAENPLEDQETERQEKEFQKALLFVESQGFHPRFIHAPNSSHFLRFNRPYYNMSRIGLALYGVHLSPSTEEKISLLPALSLKAKVVSIYTCKKGETISYGRKHTVEKEEALIGVLAIGYADGIQRHYNGKGEVLLHGKKAPFIGSICMDFLMIDLTDIPETKVGDFALLFGKEGEETLSAESFALRGSSIGHELLAALGPRIKRFFKF